MWTAFLDRSKYQGGGVSDGIYAHVSVIKANLQFEGNGCGLSCRGLRTGDKLPMNDRLCGGKCLDAQLAIDPETPAIIGMLLLLLMLLLLMMIKFLYINKYNG